ncbi:MAG: RluA family pseudouridine synthase [Treponema sp.]|nr:RluA family pseudouridine synthase [Treponema sp.]
MSKRRALTPLAGTAYRGTLLNIPILFENEECIVFNKPAGLAVQGGQGVKNSLDSILANEFSQRPLLVHRLDKDTSGVVLVAKSRDSAAFFAGVFAEKERNQRRVIKQYKAVCKGRPAAESGCISAEIYIRGAAKKAETRYRLVSMKDSPLPVSLLEIETIAGRMHQIRRHLAQTGVPVLGDDKYGDFALNKSLRKTAGLKRLLLHAERLVIPEKKINVFAPLPVYFNAFIMESEE